MKRKKSGACYVVPHGKAIVGNRLSAQLFASILNHIVPRQTNRRQKGEDKLSAESRQQPMLKGRRPGNRAGNDNSAKPCKYQEYMEGKGYKRTRKDIPLHEHQHRA